MHHRCKLGLTLCLGILLMAVATAFAVEKDDVVGQWALDSEKSNAATDGNAPGVMKEVTIKPDGTFTALYGTEGTWKIEEGKLLVTFRNSGRENEEASMDGDYLKFPAPAHADKRCYLKRVGANK